MALIRRIRVVWTGVAGTPAYTNLYFNNSGPSPQALATEVRAALALLAPVVTAAATATIEEDVALIDSVTGEIQGVAVIDTSPVSMSAAGEMLPRATNGLVHLLTNAYVGGRQLRGRVFIPYPVEAANDGGQTATTYRASIGNALNPLRVNTLGAWVVWSRKTGAIAPIETLPVWSQFAVLRSRRD